MKIKISDTEIVEAIKNSNTMAEANSKLGLHFSTFKRHAIRLGLYNPNQGAKGSNKKKSNGKGKISLLEILNGKHPQYQTFKLKNRLYEEGYFENICSICKIENWNNLKINCELDHINGKSNDHRLENLRILCPNCHSQTSNFRSRNSKNCK